MLDDGDVGEEGAYVLGFWRRDVAGNELGLDHNGDSFRGESIVPASNRIE